MEIIVALTMLIALSTAILAVSRITGIGAGTKGAKNGGRQAFPAIRPAAMQWQRVTGVVELALSRAADMSAHQAAATRQLEAADYALHTLLGELNQVMTTSVASPLVRKPRPAAPVLPLPSSALAA